jgi:hypothetical protein
MEAGCDHLVADIDITFDELFGGVLEGYLTDLEEPPQVSELYPLLINSGGKAIYREVQGSPGFTSENCVVFADDPDDLVRKCLALIKR